MPANKYRKFFKGLAVAALGAALCGGETQAQLISGPTNNSNWGRFDTSVIGGNQPGVQSGSAQVGGFVSLFDDPEKIFFIDGNSNNNLNSGNWSADIGLGSRFLHQESGAVLGGNVFYNYRNAATGQGDFDFQTVGFGFEALLQQWAFRSNAAFDVGSTQANGLVQGVGTPSYVDAMGGMGVQNIQLSGRQNNFTSALNTVDLNVSRKLDIANAELGAGVYYLSASDGPNSWGVNGTAEAWLTDSIATNVTVSHDNLFDTTVYGGVSLYFGGPRIDADARRESSTSRLWTRVQRRRVIPVVNYNLPTADLLATDPDTGDLITVLPVGQMDDLVAAPAVGTDIILVDTGAMFTGLNQINLLEGQRLLSATKIHLVDTDEVGLVMLPESGLGGTTTIDGSIGQGGVVLANDTEVSGFTITNAGGNGIYGNGVTGFDVNCNVLNSNVNGIYLQGATSGTFVNNTTNQNDFRGFHADQFNGIVDGNTSIGNSIVGFSFFGLSGGSVSNNIANENGVGIEIGTYYMLSAGEVINNTASSNDTIGFMITFSGGNSATFSTNSAIDNVTNGYSTSGVPAVGIGTNTGSGNGSNDTF